MPDTSSERTAISLAITGSGGAGVMTAGGMLLEAAARGGWYGLHTRSVGPQIRGGESAALLRLATRPVEVHEGRFHLLVALDWSNFDRFAAEIALDGDSVVIADPASGEVPAAIAGSGARVIPLAISETAAGVEGGRPNMVALGLLCEALGIEADTVATLIGEKLAAKGKAALAASTACLEAGRALGEGLGEAFRLARPRGDGKARWIVTGNEAAGLGAVRGGVRFAAAYPITPATEILEWLAPALARLGGTLVQAEDELASINMIIGASFGGVPALTATSGPGFALMTESIGLATAAEVPLVVVNVMRGGPSTGIPTKTEQADLNVAVYGLHGDAPHVVVAPTSIADCLFTTQWAVHLAEAMQVPSVVLSDQFLGQARAVTDRPAEAPFAAAREIAPEVNGGYERYALTGSGVSPMAIPGTAGCQYTADGLEHSPQGTPSTRAEDHIAQLDKRRDKLERFDYGPHWAEIDGEGETAVITWGSSTGPVREAVMQARAAGARVRMIALRLLAPCRREAMAEALEGVSRAIVVEQSHSGQFLAYLKAHYELPGMLASCRRPGPLPVTAQDIIGEIGERNAA